MVISDRYKFVFIHVPKTGGTSIKHILKKYGRLEKNINHSIDQHRSLANFYLYSSKKYCEKVKKEYYKVCFFRNPYETVVSLYNWHMNSIEFRSKFPKNYNEKKHMSFLEWLNSNPVPQQAQWFCDLNNQIGVDELYLFNKTRLQETFNDICKKIEVKPCVLPHYNKIEYKNWASYHTKKTIDKTKELYANDIQIWKQIFQKGKVKKAKKGKEYK